MSYEENHDYHITIAALRDALKYAHDDIVVLNGIRDEFADQVLALRARVTELERELDESKRAHESTAHIMDVFRSANIDNAADARQFIKELAAEREKVDELISLVCRSAPLTWASGAWIDEALKWENDAKELIDGTRLEMGEK